MSSTSANSEFYRWNFLIIDDSVAEAELTIVRSLRDKKLGKLVKSDYA